jgi:hypothetical protein
MAVGHLQSKKLVAYLVAELSWKGLIGAALWLDPVEGAFPRWALLTMVVTAGFIEVGYILGQSYVDGFLRATAPTTSIRGKRDDDKED